MTNLSNTFDFMVLDDFELPDIRVVNPAQTDPKKKNLWNQYESDFTEGPDPGTCSISTDGGITGQNSLKVNVTAGNIYLQFYTNNGSIWKNAYEFTTGWTNDKYNKMSFWVKLPTGVIMSGGDNKNATVGTYVRSTTGDKTSAEAGGNHYYHFYALSSTDEWQQIIVDMHPDHRRGASGGLEHDYVPYRTGETGYNYFDTLTRFYFEIDGLLSGGGYPADFLVDRFEFIHDTNDENYEQVGSLTGVYVTATNTILVNWRRRKDEPGAVHNLRYAFSSIHALGWDNATAFSGMSSDTGSNFDYAGMHFANSSVDFTGQTSVFVAIRPAGSTRIREIELPIVGASVPTTYDYMVPDTDWTIVHEGSVVKATRSRGSQQLSVGTVYQQTTFTTSGVRRVWLACKVNSCTPFNRKSEAVAHLQ